MVMMSKSESIAYQRKKLPSITWNGEDTTTSDGWFYNQKGIQAICYGTKKTFMFEGDLLDFSLRSHFCTFINKINCYIIEMTFQSFGCCECM